MKHYIILALIITGIVLYISFTVTEQFKSDITTPLDFDFDIKTGKILNIHPINIKYNTPPNISIVGGDPIVHAILRTELKEDMLYEIKIINPGHYKKKPILYIISSNETSANINNGHDAYAKSIISNLRVIGIEVINTGYNYLAPPKIDIISVDGQGRGATAKAELNNGYVVAINVTNSGFGYVKPPIIKITPVSKNTNTNTILNEINTNWAITSHATQSTSFAGHLAELGLDGNINTYSRTNIGLTDFSWYEIEMNHIIKIDNITLYMNTKYSIPFKLEILDSMRLSMTQYTLNKHTDKIPNISIKQDKTLYIIHISDVFSFGKYVKISQLSKNYLQIHNIIINGTPALSCDMYKTDKALFSTCSKLSEQKSYDLEIIQKHADEFDHISNLDHQENIKNQKIAAAKLALITSHLEEEKQMKLDALKYKLPPPPTRYTDKDIKEAHDAAKTVIKRNLTTVQKANCMKLLNKAIDARDRAELAGSNTDNKSSAQLRLRTKQLSDSSEALMKEYNKQCK